MKTSLIVVSSICVILIIILTVQNLKTDAQKFDSGLLVGDWKDSDGYARLSVKGDNTFKVSFGFQQDFNGTWVTKDIYFDSDTTSLLILKNSTEKKNDPDDYKYYFFQIDRLSKEKIKLTDLTGTSRRNRVSVFEREF